jgi:hypothetical protein
MSIKQNRIKRRENGNSFSPSEQRFGQERRVNLDRPSKNKKAKK